MSSHAADPLRSGSTSFFTAEAPRLIIIMAIMFVLLGAYAKSFGDAANSRLATVLSLTQHGSFYIDPVDGVAKLLVVTDFSKRE